MERNCLRKSCHSQSLWLGTLATLSIALCPAALAQGPSSPTPSTTSNERSGGRPGCSNCSNSGTHAARAARDESRPDGVPAHACLSARRYGARDSRTRQSWFAARCLCSFEDDARALRSGGRAMVPDSRLRCRVCPTTWLWRNRRRMGRGYIRLQSPRFCACGARDGARHGCGRRVPDAPT
jgi:hypothetical protein